LLGRVVGIFAEFHPLPSSTDQNTAYQPDLWLLCYVSFSYSCGNHIYFIFAV
jgi:hypothetical protein